MFVRVYISILMKLDTFSQQIDENAGRYRLMSDGALEIVSLYRNDTGGYICVADNGLGVASQEIHLVVNGEWG